MPIEQVVALLIAECDRILPPRSAVAFPYWSKIRSNSAFKMGFGSLSASTTRFAHSKYSLFRSSSQSAGGLFRIERRFEILSANLITWARGFLGRILDLEPLSLRFRKRFIVRHFRDKVRDIQAEPFDELFTLDAGVLNRVVKQRSDDKIRVPFGNRR